ncbi:hypothetical protein CL656_04845 [bacterium]|nr:hypothetical protein [bacterium]
MIYSREFSIETTNNDYLDTFGSLSNAKSKCFNIGAGTWEHPCWTNIDLKPQSEAFAKIQAPCIYHDLVKSNQLPIKADSALMIYSSHVIEHLPDKNVIELIKSSFNSLKKGGIIRITTGPNAETDFNALKRKDKKWWYFYNDNPFNCLPDPKEKISLYDYWLLHFASPRSVYSPTPSNKKYSGFEIKDLLAKYSNDRIYLQNIFTDSLEFNINYPGNHLSWWSPKKLMKILIETGFSSASSCAFGQSSNYLFRDTRYFDNTYPQISMYVEAIK